MKPVSENDLLDIYGHLHVPFWQTSLFKIGAIAGTVLVLLALLAPFIKKFIAKKSESPAQKALRILQELRMRQALSREDIHQVYFTLTTVLKEFFQSHFNHRFEGLTDQEMIQALEKTALPTQFHETIATLVHESSGVKYARQDGLKNRLNHHIDACCALIKEISLNNSVQQK
jgi:chorismate mutase